MTDLTRLTHFILDVDGTMTDSGLYFDDNGNELKRFSSRDFIGVMAAHFAGIKIMIVTGRKCPATERRAKELRIDYLYQGVKNKKAFIEEFMRQNGIEKENLGYIGDDLNDYSAMKLSGFVTCPSDACPEIIAASDYVSKAKGGQGVVNDVFRFVLGKTDRWDAFLNYLVEIEY